MRDAVGLLAQPVSLLSKCNPGWCLFTENEFKDCVHVLCLELSCCHISLHCFMLEALLVLYTFFRVIVGYEIPQFLAVSSSDLAKGSSGP